MSALQSAKSHATQRATWLLSWLMTCSGLAACGHEERSLRPAASAAREPAVRPPDVKPQSAPLCALVGPRDDNQGVYGTDLGYSVATGTAPDSPLLMLFGDTWTEAGDACRYPGGTSDDLVAFLPPRPPARLASAKATGSQRCGLLHYELGDRADVRSWPRVRLFLEQRPDGSLGGELDMGMLRTPVAVFRDATDVYAIFHRNDAAFCAADGDCPEGMQCSTQLPQSRLGICELPGLPYDMAPSYCRSDDDCAIGSCARSPRGMCLTTTPFELETPHGPASPAWYRQDLRRGLARVMYLARMSKQHPGHFIVVQRFVTNRFTNLAARTVAHFDPERPERNDYRPGAHTLLLWGRSAFATTGGAQSLPFLLYQRLPQKEGAPLRWDPHFFAGQDDAGAPIWSAKESDALPIYGTEARVVQSSEGTHIDWKQPEFDYVNQMSLSWLAPLGRWVMLYGGDVSAFLVADPQSGDVPEPVHPEPAPGAIHMRLARHPWGGSPGDPGSAWSSPRPVLTRADAAHYMACPDDEDVARRIMPGCLEEGDPNTPLDLLATLAGFTTELTPDAFAEISKQCLEGEVAMTMQAAASGDPVGRLYGANIIEPWTREQEGAVELYWNVSTWNPYQVLLVKTRLQR